MITKTVFRDYKIKLQFTPGGQGSVFLVENLNTKEQFALKCIYVEESPKKEIEEMIETWKKLCSSKEKDLFVKYKEHFYEESNCLIVMEFCVGGDLQSAVKKKFLEIENFSEHDVLNVLTDVMSALMEMHNQGFLHGDIKSANVLIGKDGKYKLCDFGTSLSLGSLGVSRTVVGSAEFSAPEVVNSEMYSYPADIFSVGVILYQMMVGKTPFANERGVVMKNLMVGKYEPIPLSAGYSAHLVDIVHSCLRLNPALRPSTQEVLTRVAASAEVEVLAPKQLGEGQGQSQGPGASVLALQATIAGLQKKLAEQENVTAEQQKMIDQQQKVIEKLLETQKAMGDLTDQIQNLKETFDKHTHKIGRGYTVTGDATLHPYHNHWIQENTTSPPTKEEDEKKK